MDGLSTGDREVLKSPTITALSSFSLNISYYLLIYFGAGELGAYLFTILYFIFNYFIEV